MARTPDGKGGTKVTAFLTTPDMPGFHVGKKEAKLGLRASPTVQLHFENLRVPVENLLGDPHMGFIYAMQSLDNGRLGIAAQAVGIARAALEHATRYAAERRQFKRPIKEFQAMQFKLADMARAAPIDARRVPTCLSLLSCITSRSCLNGSSSLSVALPT